LAHSLRSDRAVTAPTATSVDFLFDVAIEMEPEDGLICVHGLDDDSVMAFTDEGVDSLVELIKITGKCRRHPCADLCRERRPAAHGAGLR
jgi:hypothetical protein